MLEEFFKIFSNCGNCLTEIFRRVDRNVYALNMEAWNSALMYGLSLPEDGTCQLDWTTQNYYQLTMMEEKRLAANTTHAHHLAENYLGKLSHQASIPTFPISSYSCFIKTSGQFFDKLSLNLKGIFVWLFTWGQTIVCNEKVDPICTKNFHL